MKKTSVRSKPTRSPNKAPVIAFQLPTNLYDAIKTAATKDDRKCGSWVRRALTERMIADGFLKAEVQP